MITLVPDCPSTCAVNASNKNIKMAWLASIIARWKGILDSLLERYQTAFSLYLDVDCIGFFFSFSLLNNIAVFVSKTNFQYQNVMEWEMTVVTIANPIGLCHLMWIIRMGLIPNDSSCYGK